MTLITLKGDIFYKLCMCYLRCLYTLYIDKGKGLHSTVHLSTWLLYIYIYKVVSNLITMFRIGYLTLKHLESIIHCRHSVWPLPVLQ